jgi:RNA polymerase-binding transcription factor DksA
MQERRTGDQKLIMKKKTKKVTKKVQKVKQVKKAKPALKAKVAPKKVAPKKVTVKNPSKTAKAKEVANATATPVADEPKHLKLSKVDALKFKKLLLDLRDHLIDGVNFLANENLKRSSRDASGELSGYSLHMADAGTDNFDREFALSLVSNEQEALYEIEEALKRLEQGVYGLCGNCEKPIRKERLEAVPFARLCVQCQAGIEKNSRRPIQPIGLFNESGDEEGGDSEDSEE